MFGRKKRSKDAQADNSAVAKTDLPETPGTPEEDTAAASDRRRDLQTDEPGNVYEEPRHVVVQGLTAGPGEQGTHGHADQPGDRLHQ